MPYSLQQCAIYLLQRLTTRAHQPFALVSRVSADACLKESIQTVQWVLNPGASAFYEEAGSAAAALGVTVSIFAASARTCGLHAMQALVGLSGGCIRLYPALQHAAIPQARRALLVLS